MDGTMKKKKTENVLHGPRLKQKHPVAWPSGIIPPPLLVSSDSSILTTSSISGRLSGLASQHFFMIFAIALGQHRGISGRMFCISSIASKNYNAKIVLAK